MGFWGTAGSAAVGYGAMQYAGRASGAMAGLARGQGSTAMALNAIPIVGPALAAAVQAAEQVTDIATGASQATAHTAGQTGLGALGGDLGMAKYGVAQTELAGQLATLAQQSGLRGSALREAAPELLRTQAVTGVSGGLMAGAAGTSGGAMSPERALTLTQEAIAAGMDAGFRDARLGQFVQSIASDIEQMRSRGIMIDPTALPDMVRLFGQSNRAGLTGEAGLHAAKTMTETVQGSGQRNDFYGALAMRTAMDQGMSAFQAQMALEENPEQFVPKILDKIGQMGGSDEAKAMALKQFMPQLSMRQAYEMASGATEGEFGPEAAAIGKEGAAGRGEDYIAKQDEETRSGFGLASSAAGLENQRISVGKKVGGDVYAMRRNEMELAKQGAPLGAKAGKFASGVISRYGKALGGENPLQDIMKMLMEDLSSSFTTIAKEVTKAVQAGVKGMLGMDSEEMGEGLQRQLGTSEGREEVLNEIKKILDSIWGWLQGVNFDPSSWLPKFADEPPKQPHRGFRMRSGN